jgi:hypothetical protein
MKSEAVGRLSVVRDNLVESVEEVVKDGSSQFQKFHVNSHKFHGPRSKRLLQLG